MKMGAEFWVEHVAAAGLETIPASEYARRHGLSVPALYYWQRKLRAATTDIATELPKHARSAHASKFVALRVTDKVAVPTCQCTLVMRKRSTNPNLFRKSFRWLNPAQENSRETTIQILPASWLRAGHAGRGATRYRALGHWPDRKSVV